MGKPGVLGPLSSADTRVASDATMAMMLIKIAALFAIRRIASPARCGIESTGYGAGTPSVAMFPTVINYH